MNNEFTKWINDFEVSAVKISILNEKLNAKICEKIGSNRIIQIYTLQKYSFSIFSK